MRSLCIVQLEQWNWLFLAMTVTTLHWSACVHWKTTREAIRTYNVSQHAVKEARQCWADCAKALSVNRNPGCLLSRKLRKYRALWSWDYSWYVGPTLLHFSILNSWGPVKHSTSKLSPQHINSVVIGLCALARIKLSKSQGQRHPNNCNISSTADDTATSSPLCVSFAPRRSRLVSWHCLKCTRQKTATTVD